MMLAEVAVTVPYWNPEFTTGSITLCVTIAGCIGGACWWFTKLFSRSQVSFAELKLGLISMQTDLTAYKNSQDLKLDAVHVELRKQTEILTKQEILAVQIGHIDKTQERFQTHLENLETAFRNFRVGSVVSEQAQRGVR